MSELETEHAKEVATRARNFLARFADEYFGELSAPRPHDRQDLGMALDVIEELSAMVLNLADRVPPAPSDVISPNG